MFAPNQVHSFPSPHHTRPTNSNPASLQIIPRYRATPNSNLEQELFIPKHHSIMGACLAGQAKVSCMKFVVFVVCYCYCCWFGHSSSAFKRGQGQKEACKGAGRIVVLTDHHDSTHTFFPFLSPPPNRPEPYLLRPSLCDRRGEFSCRASKLRVSLTEPSLTGNKKRNKERPFFQERKTPSDLSSKPDSRDSYGNGPSQTSAHRTVPTRKGVTIT